MPIQLTKEEFEKKFGIAPSSTPTAQPTAAAPLKTGGFGDEVKSRIGQTGSDVADIYNQGVSGEISPLRAGTGIVGKAFSAIPGLAKDALPEFAEKGLEKVGAGVGKGLTWLGDKIGGTQALQNFVNKYPEAAKSLEDIAGTAANTGEIAGNILLAQGAANVAQKAIPKVANMATKPVQPVLEGAGRTLKRMGEKSYSTTVNPSESTAKALMSYDAKQPNIFGRVKNMIKGTEDGRPVTEANTAARKGLIGTEYEIGVQAKKISGQLWDKEIQPRLAQVKGKVNMKNFFDEVEKELQKTAELSRRSDVKDALNSLRADYQNVGKNVNLETLQNYKSGWAKVIPEAAYRGKPIGSALKEVKSIAAEKARKLIYKYIGDEGKQAYLDYGNLQSVIEAGAKSIAGDAAKRSLGRNIWELIMDKAITPVATTAGKVLYRTGEGLEFLGKPGARKVGDIFGSDITPSIVLQAEQAVKSNVKNSLKNPKIGLSIEDVSKSKLPKIDPADQEVMKQVIDAVRLKKGMTAELELDASRIAEAYGLNMPKSLTGLANEFDRVLSKLKSTFGPKQKPFPKEDQWVSFGGRWP